MSPRVVVTERRSPSERCPYCHDDLREPTTACAACHVRCHAECRALLGRCPTLGCEAAAPPRDGARWTEAAGDARRQLVGRIYKVAFVHALLAAVSVAAVLALTGRTFRHADAQGALVGLALIASLVTSITALRAPLLHFAVARLLRASPLDMTLKIIEKFEGSRTYRGEDEPSPVLYAELYVPQSGSGPARRITVRLSSLLTPGPSWLTELPRYQPVPVRVWGAPGPGPVVIETPGGRLYAASSWSVERHRGVV